MEKPNEDMAFMQKIQNKQLGQSSFKVVFLIGIYFFLVIFWFPQERENCENIMSEYAKANS